MTTIYKYGNRKLYDTKSRSYTNFKGLVERLKEGPIKVIQRKYGLTPGADITKQILTSLLMSQLKAGASRLSVEELTNRVVNGNPERV